MHLNIYSIFANFLRLHKTQPPPHDRFTWEPVTLLLFNAWRLLAYLVLSSFFSSRSLSHSRFQFFFVCVCKSDPVWFPSRQTTWSHKTFISSQSLIQPHKTLVSAFPLTSPRLLLPCNPEQRLILSNTIVNVPQQAQDTHAVGYLYFRDTPRRLDRACLTQWIATLLLPLVRGFVTPRIVFFLFFWWGLYSFSKRDTLDVSCSLLQCLPPQMTERALMGRLGSPIRIFNKTSG